MRIKKQEMRNNLETLIYKQKEWLEGKEPNIYGKEEEITKCKDSVKEIAEWFDDEAFSADFETLENKFKLLKADFSDIDNRMTKHKNREAAVENFNTNIDKIIADANKLKNEKKWMEEYFNKSFMREVNSIKNWYKEMSERQKALKLNEVGLFNIGSCTYC